jgi:excisionase family DNA binding protein
MATKIKYIRTNAAGLPSKYSCDRCGLPARRGVYTGDNTFTHICEWCKGVRTRLIAARGSGVSGTPRAWTVYGANEQAERVQTALRIAATMGRIAGKRAVTIKARLGNAPISEWLTAAEAAAHLRIAHRTLVRWARGGRVPAHRLSGTGRVTWRFLRSELDAMLTASSVGSAETGAA